MMNSYRIINNKIIKNNKQKKFFKDNATAKKWLIRRFVFEGEQMLAEKELKWHNPKIEKILIEAGE